MVTDRPRLSLLRARTRAAHASIEQVPAMARLMSPDLTQMEYVGVLQHMHAFLTAMDPALAIGLAPCPAAAVMLDGERCLALAEDLTWFGTEPILTAPSLPNVQAVAAALGALYVIEGSNLGGRIIARHVADSLGVKPQAGGSFYGGLNAEAIRARWAALCDLLESPETATGARPDVDQPVKRSSFDEIMAAGACATFACLELWMRKIPVAAARRPLVRAAAI